MTLLVGGLLLAATLGAVALLYAVLDHNRDKEAD